MTAPSAPPAPWTAPLPPPSLIRPPSTLPPGPGRRCSTGAHSSAVAAVVQANRLREPACLLPPLLRFGGEGKGVALSPPSRFGNGAGGLGLFPPVRPPSP